MSAIVAALIAGVFSIVAAIATALANNKLSKNTSKEHRAAVTIANRKLFVTLSRLHRETRSDRTIIIVAENGAIRDKESAKFVSVVDEIYNEPLDSSIDRFYRFKVDAAYRKLIDDLLEDKTVLLIPSEMQTGFLKSYDESRNIYASYVFAIKETQTRLLFCSISFLNAVNFTEPKFLAAVDSAKHSFSRIHDAIPELFDPIEPA